MAYKIYEIGTVSAGNRDAERIETFQFVDLNGNGVVDSGDSIAFGVGHQVAGGDPVTCFMGCYNQFSDHLPKSIGDRLAQLIRFAAFVGGNVPVEEFIAEARKRVIGNSAEPICSLQLGGMMMGCADTFPLMGTYDEGFDLYTHIGGGTLPPALNPKTVNETAKAFSQRLAQIKAGQ